MLRGTCVNVYAQIIQHSRMSYEHVLEFILNHVRIMKSVLIYLDETYI